MLHAAAAAAAGRVGDGAMYPRGAVAAGHRLTAVRPASPVGWSSAGSGHDSLPSAIHLYAQFKWHTQRRRPASTARPESVAVEANPPARRARRRRDRTEGRTDEGRNLIMKLL